MESEGECFIVWSQNVGWYSEGEIALVGEADHNSLNSGRGEGEIGRAANGVIASGV